MFLPIIKQGARHARELRCLPLVPADADGMRWHPPFSVNVETVVPSLTVVRPDKPIQLIPNGVVRIVGIECIPPVPGTIGTQQGVDVVTVVDGNANVDGLIVCELVDNSMHIEQQGAAQAPYVRGSDELIPFTSTTPYAGTWWPITFAVAGEGFAMLP